MLGDSPGATRHGLDGDGVDRRENTDKTQRGGLELLIAFLSLLLLPVGVLSGCSPRFTYLLTKRIWDRSTYSIDIKEGTSTPSR